MNVILFNYYIIVATFIGIFLLIPAPQLRADEVEANLIQVINTSNFPAPDPAGIVYLSSQDAFLVSDSEVNEMTIFQGDNVFKVDRHGSLLETYSTIPFSSEPTGITINPMNNHCFFSDDNRRVIYEINPGDDDLCLTADDTVTSFATDTHFGSGDPEDVTYGLESLFILDGFNNRVYRISANNGVFANVTANNLVNSFDTQSLGVTDPEGIVFDSRNDSLFIVGRHEKYIIQTTFYGILLKNINISTLNANNPAGLALGPSSEDPTMTNLYMVARGVDNNSDPNENDGVIYELEIPTIITPLNHTPAVAAGIDQSIILPANALLNGSVSDDGIPDNTLTATWSKQSGPGSVSFTDPNHSNTTASFSTAGTYVLRLTGYDGQLYSFDDLSILVTSNGASDVTALQSRVSANGDDAEENPDGSMDLNSSDLELVFDHELQTVGIRFTALSIPENATISKAYIQFKVDEKSIANAQFSIYGESKDNALGFSKSNHNISSRIKTNTSVPWSPAPWNTVGTAGADQRTSDLTVLVQEIVSGTGWHSGNAMVFIFTGSGTRVAESYNGDPAGAPLLYLEYTTGVSTIPPVLTLTGANPMNLNLGDTFIDPGATATDDIDGDITATIHTISDVDTSVAATYTVTYSVTDSDDNTVSATRSVIVSNGTSQVTVLQSRISASADDAKERAGSVYLTSSDLELVFDNNYLQIIGLRFSALSIPVNAVITKAYIQFEADETDILLDTQLNIVAEKNNNAATFTSGSYNISTRSKTNASVTWSPAAWNTIGASGVDQRSSDLTAIVQEIVSETGWSSGNAMAFIFTGSGKRVAVSYEGDRTGAPLLYVEYTTE